MSNNQTTATREEVRKELFTSVFYTIQSEISPKCTYQQMVGEEMIFTFGYGTVNSSDVNRINALCRIHNFDFLIREREKCVDIKVWDNED